MSEKEFNELFSANLRRFMDRDGITQAELAKRVHVSATSIGNWVNGIKTPRMDKIDQLCQIFSCNRSDLMEDKGEDPVYYLNPETAKAAQEMLDNRELRVLFDAARDAKPEDLRTVYDMLMALKRKEQGDPDSWA